MNNIDVYSRNPYPSNYLSNFYPHSFYVGNVYCSSMEGFLQSLTVRSKSKQRHICTLVGLEAKRSHNPSWKDEYMLYWDGCLHDRFEPEYQYLLNKAYEALFHNKAFRNALKATNDKVITHKMGSDDMSRTILTEYEFCSRLMVLRSLL